MQPPQTVGASRERAERLGREAILSARRAGAAARAAQQPCTRSFYRQAEAFHAADLSFLSAGPLDRWRGKVFSQERPTDGVRLFAFAPDVREFWRTLCLEPPARRHWYEIIREDTPCHLYFDLEFKCGSGTASAIDSASACRHLLWWTAVELAHAFDVHIRQTDVVILESSTPTKFSRHIVVRLPDGIMFRDARHAGAFVRKIFGSVQKARLLSPAIDALWVAAPLDAPTDIADVAAAADSTLSEGAPIAQKLFFADLGVYTRNRAMRMLFCSKFRKAARLLPAAENAFAGVGSHGPPMSSQSHDAASLHEYWAHGCPCSSHCLAAATATCVDAGGRTDSPPVSDLGAVPTTLAPSSASASASVVEVLPCDPRNASGSVAAVQVGSTAWEASMWRGSLITDLLAPLWLECKRADLLASGLAPSRAELELWLAQRASCLPVDNPRPSVHPTRGFRLLYCESDVGGVVLQPPSSNSDVTGASMEADASLSGLKRSRAVSLPRELSPGMAASATVALLGSASSSGGARPPFPALVAWILAELASGKHWQTCRAGSTPTLGSDSAPRIAIIRSWQAECIDVPLVPYAADGSFAVAPFPVNARIVTQLRLDTCGSRWCARIGRHHRSNNVVWHVNLGRQVAWQTCLDPQCRAERFASRTVPLPPELIPNQVPPGFTISAAPSSGMCACPSEAEKS